jgi:hypothetical protein
VVGDTAAVVVEAKAGVACEAGECGQVVALAVENGGVVDAQPVVYHIVGLARQAAPVHVRPQAVVGQTSAYVAVPVHREVVQAVTAAAGQRVGVPAHAVGHVHHAHSLVHSIARLAEGAHPGDALQAVAGQLGRAEVIGREGVARDALGATGEGGGLDVGEAVEDGGDAEGAHHLVVGEAADAGPEAVGVAAEGWQGAAVIVGVEVVGVHALVAFARLVEVVDPAVGNRHHAGPRHHRVAPNAARADARGVGPCAEGRQRLALPLGGQEVLGDALSAGPGVGVEGLAVGDVGQALSRHQPVALHAAQAGAR